MKTRRDAQLRWIQNVMWRCQTTSWYMNCKIFLVITKELGSSKTKQPRSHTSNTSLARVREIFPRKLISWRGDLNWAPRSADLSPMDFFLWGYVKSKVYVNNSTSLARLRENTAVTRWQPSRGVYTPSRHEKSHRSFKWVPWAWWITLRWHNF